MEELARLLREILDRLDQLEARSVMSYAKGTYAPTYLGAVTAGATTYTIQAGFWCRIGRVMVASGTLVWTAATGTGNAQISLPFAAVNTTNMFWTGSIRNTTVTFANSTPQVEGPAPGASVFILQSPLTNAASTPVAIEAAGNLIFTVIYFVV